jgi:hypothetical protein
MDTNTSVALTRKLYDSWLATAETLAKATFDYQNTIFTTVRDTQQTLVLNAFKSLRPA